MNMNNSPTYRYAEMFEEAGMGGLDTSINYLELYSGRHNNIWHNIARDGSRFAYGYDSQDIGRLVLQLREDGFVAGQQLADALELAPSTDAYVTEEKDTLKWLKGYVQTCRLSEYAFSQLNYRYKPYQPGEQLGGYVSILDEDNKPLLIEANAIGGVASKALSLREIVVDGVPYPAGFIFGAVHAYTNNVRPGTLPSGHTILAESIADIHHLQPRRASVWSVPLEERCEIFGDLIGMHNAEEEYIYCRTEDWEISDFAEVVGQAEFDEDPQPLFTRDLRRWDLGLLIH